MENDNTKELGRVVHIDEGKIRGHLDEMVRGTVEQTLNDLLDAEADRLCNAPKYARSPDRVDSRAGHYERKLLTKAGEVKLKVPKLREAIFETHHPRQLSYFRYLQINYPRHYLAIPRQYE